MTTLLLTKVEASLLIEALDEYLESKSGLKLNHSDETRMAILEDILDVICRNTYGDESSVEA